MSIFFVAEIICDICEMHGEESGLVANSSAVVSALKETNKGWKITKQETICPKCRK